MKYTLDSVTHAIAVVEATLKEKVISVEPILITDFTDLGKRIINRYLFGRMTVGNGMEKVTFLLNNDLIIEIDPNSQIDLLFDRIYPIFEDSSLNGKDFMGQFRGFELIVRGSKQSYDPLLEITPV